MKTLTACAAAVALLGPFTPSHGLTSSRLPTVSRPQRQPRSSFRAAASRHELTTTTTLAFSSSDSNGRDDSDGHSRTRLSGLNAAIVGAGPSGLLLAHRLLQSGASSVSVFESRSDPRSSLSSSKGGALEGRAYALGLGVRGRSAIRTVDEQLWDNCKTRGYESDRFTLHVSQKIRFRLRDGQSSRQRRAKRRGHMKRKGEREEDDDASLEPSVLLYQTDLCAALLDDLERRQKDEEQGGERGKLSLHFNARAVEADLDSRCLEILVDNDDDDGNESSSMVEGKRAGPFLDKHVGPYDLIVGCDGVNSRIRRSIQRMEPSGTVFDVEIRDLPGEYKVARLPSMPPKLDPTSVALLLPSGKGESGASVTAFVEPTVDGTACVLFAGRGGERGGGSDAESSSSKEGGGRGKDPILSDPISNVADSVVENVTANLVERFPLLDGADLTDAVRQLLTQRPASASSVKCNVYHCGCMALCGDAAHATGGVSGQGCNSALVDAAVLADCLEECFDREKGVKSVESALLAYSQRQVPEGLALYDLSFGPGGDVGFLFRIRFALGTLLDTVFGGRFKIGQPPLQTQLTTSLRPFADIRRDRSAYYMEKFPDNASFNQTLADLYAKTG